MGLHGTQPAGEPVKLFGSVIQQPGSHQINPPLKAPASPCSDGSDTEIWRPDQPRGLYWPACQPPPQAIAGPPAGSLRADSFTDMQDAAAILSKLGSCRGMGPAPPAQPVSKPTTSTVASRRRPSAATGAQLAPNMKACSSCREVKPHALFHACKAKRDGLQDRCKACRAELDRQRLAQARAANGRLGGNKSPRKRALGRTQSESDSHATAKRARGPAAAFKQWAALQWDAPAMALGVHRTGSDALPSLQQHCASSVLPVRRQPDTAVTPTAQPPAYLPDAHARRRYPEWQQGPQPVPPLLTRPPAPAAPTPRMSCSRASAPAAPLFPRPAPPAAQGWQLDADRRLGRIAAVLTSATGFCSTHSVHISEFVVLTGALLPAACVLRHGRAQEVARSRQVAAQQQQYWHAAAAALAVQHHRSQPPAAAPHFRHVLA